MFLLALGGRWPPCGARCVRWKLGFDNIKVEEMCSFFCRKNAWVVGVLVRILVLELVGENFESHLDTHAEAFF
ncbi:hypothetical protein [Rubritalea tangerina]|uniref:hypothetical protein n=1 Tax=Rubritalea tangerina TaxID=430798 RepID=UPI003619AE0B